MPAAHEALTSNEARLTGWTRRQPVPDGHRGYLPGAALPAREREGSGPAEAAVRHEPHHRHRGEQGVGVQGLTNASAVAAA